MVPEDPGIAVTPALEPLIAEASAAATDCEVLD
jgi:hypothetical protein